MDKSGIIVSDPVVSTLGERLRKMRRDKGMTQEVLAGPEFTKGYVSALERGAVRPSLKALDVFARRLEVPIADFLVPSISHDLQRDLSLEAQQEDFVYQCNYTKMLLRSGQLTEAMRLIDEIEENAKSYVGQLPPNVSYLIPFLRGRAYLQSMQPNLARRELETALNMIKEDLDESSRVGNLLGVVFFELGLPQLAVEHHLACLKAIQGMTERDPNFQISVYRNLANDYWALNEPDKSISVYKEALLILEDLNDMERQARVYWGLAMAYQRSNNWSQAKLYGLRALHILEAADNRSEAASICGNLSEILIGEGRYDEAKELLERADKLVSGTGNQTTMSYLYRNYADIARRQGDFHEATRYAGESVRLAEAFYEAANSSEDHAAGGVDTAQGSQPSAQSGQVWQDPARTYAEALQMEALVQESQGSHAAADSLFQQALGLLDAGGFEETRYAITFSYAEILSARGAFEKAMHYYKAAAQFRSAQSRRSAN